MKSDGLFYGLWPVCRKEFTHIVRDPGTLFFALLIPLLQMLLLGYAVDTNVRQIPTVVLNESQTQESRQLLDRMAASDVFRMVMTVESEQELYAAMRSGRARVGIRIPYDYARRLQDGTTASVLVLVDGSESSAAGQAVNAATGVALEQSLERLVGGGTDADRDAAFGAVQPGDSVGELLCAGIDRDSAADDDDPADCAEPGAGAGAGDAGAADDDSGEAAGPDGGKDDSVWIAGVRRAVRDPDDHAGDLSGADPWECVCAAGDGGAVSSDDAWLGPRDLDRERRRRQRLFNCRWERCFLRCFSPGYIFLIDTMPAFFRGVSRLVPATYFIAILRGIILRGAGFRDLWVNALVLTVMGCAAILLAARQICQAEPS